MATSSSQPSSPTKRILRSIVTGVQSTDPDTHAQRWNKTGSTEKGMKLSTGQSTGGGARVRGLVDEYERSFSSKPYSAMPQASNSPIRTNFTSTPTSVGRTLPVLATTQISLPSPTSSSHSSTDSRSPTTVPASFFQMQQARRTPPASPNGAKFLPSPVSREGKENQPRPTFQPSPRLQPTSLPHQRPLTPSKQSGSSNGTVSGGSDVSQATSAMTGLTLETMATRSSNSTHANTNSAESSEEASLRTASKIQVQEQATPRKISVSQIATPPIRTATVPFPPQIVQTAPTPRRQVAPSSIPLHAGERYTRPSPIEQLPPSPPLPPRSPCGSSFVEALPASYPSRSPTTSPLPSPNAQIQTDYKPLPLVNPSRSPSPNLYDPQPASRPQPRARASTLGSGIKPSFASEQIRVESAEEKRKRVEGEFERLLVSLRPFFSNSTSIH